MTTRCSWLLALVAGLAVMGCSERTLPKETVYPTRGKVTIDGKPVSMAIIEFEPQTPGKGADCWGVVGPSGLFAIRTYSNAQEPDGAIPGVYKVKLLGFDPSRGGSVPKGTKVTPIDPKYGDASRNQTVEVKAGDNKLTLDFK
jgi:hypothetical protein